MKFDIITLFPKTAAAIFDESILKLAQESRIVEINVHDLRNWTNDKRKTVDDKPFGGGPGMLMQIEPVYKAFKDLGIYPNRNPEQIVLLTSAKGEQWKQQLAAEYSTKYQHIVILCGYYEGVDHRIVEHLIDKEISIGGYILTGGHLAAGVIVDSITRLLPGALGNPSSITEESHSETDYLEYPQYTRPAEFVTAEGDSWAIPEVLLSGNHADIAKWRTEQSRLNS